MARIRYKPNRRGMLNILGGEPMRADLHARATNMAVVAQAEYDARPPHQGEVNVIVDSQAGTPAHPRARAAVIAQHPAVLHIERKRRTLGAAMDALGGG